MIDTEQVNVLWNADKPTSVLCQQPEAGSTSVTNRHESLNSAVV
jgi:hypothetical protein